LLQFSCFFCNLSSGTFLSKQVFLSGTVKSLKAPQKGRTRMYARVMTVQLQPGKIEEAIQIYRDSTVPSAKQLQGFKSALFLTDATTGKGISITMWETEADLKASETSGWLQEQPAKFASLFTATPVQEVYEVALNE
jgi:heme-degrading monooxygenase HmoA